MSERRIAYRPDEAARLLGVSRRTIYRYITDGLLDSYRIDRAVFIPADALDKIGGTS